MNTPMQVISSKLKTIWIEANRFIDHTYRKSIGVPTSRRSMITPQLFVGGQYSEIGLNTLHRREFTAIVNIREDSFEKKAKEKGFHYLHLPTLDLHAISLDHLRKGVQFIRKEIEKGGRVYVHCYAGEGRGPSMAIAYLMSTGLTFDDAFTQVQKVRIFIKLTDNQVKRLKEFEKELQKK